MSNEDDGQALVASRGVLRRYDRSPEPVDLDAVAPPTPTPQVDVDELRRRALTVACPVPRCRARVGELCRNVTDRTPLQSQPAHVQRITVSGAELPPVTSTERKGWPTRRTEASRQQLVREAMRRMGRW